MLHLLAFPECIGSGIVGGVLFGFSTFAMPALAQLPSDQGVGAMQRINVVDLNPAFLEIFLGTAVVAVVCIVASFLAWSGVRSVLILLAGILYLVGSFSLTMCFNVPGSERLARIDSSSSEAAA